ncbi:Cysteamine dioxygenase [Cynara cardunculus var. scolymus]|uniref:cysteine dioxygenase n=1 Tax=Cynara cardunculus var. scolymus TaxID=59895 RepID=A0A124SEG4_CYNCS|nr:Cysteamine dioxygenase [Cynara cardunculus var. scolymus]
MTIEVRLADMSKSIRKKKCCRKTSSKRKRSPPSPAAISFPLQRLYISCLDVFKGVGTVPSPTDVQKLCHILDRMMPEDVGLSRNLQFFKPRSNVGLSIFFLPANAVIPLHNHPGMTVFVKLLLGKVHIKAYDLVSTENSDDSNSILPSQHERAVMSGEESERYWWLEEIEVPKESEMEGIEYMGPQIIEMSSS